MERTRHLSVNERLVRANIQVFRQLPDGWRVVEEDVSVSYLTSDSLAIETSESGGSYEPHRTHFDDVFGPDNWAAILITSTAGRLNESFVSIATIMMWPPKLQRRTTSGVWLRLVQ